MPSIHFAIVAPHHAAVPNAALLHLHPALAIGDRCHAPRWCASSSGSGPDPHHLDHRQDRGDPVRRFSSPGRGHSLRQEQGVARLWRSPGRPSRGAGLMPCSTCRPPCAPASPPSASRPRSNSVLIGARQRWSSGCSPTIGSPHPLPHVLDGFLAFAKRARDKGFDPGLATAHQRQAPDLGEQKIGGSRPCSSALLPARHSRLDCRRLCRAGGSRCRQGLSGLSVRRTGQAGADSAPEIQRQPEQAGRFLGGADQPQAIAGADWRGAAWCWPRIPARPTWPPWWGHP